MKIYKVLATLAATLIGGAAAASQDPECVVTHTGKAGKTESKLQITKEITTNTYGIFKVTVEAKKANSTSVVIEANGMKSAQAGSGTTKAKLSNGNERIEVVCYPGIKGK